MSADPLGRVIRCPHCGQEFRLDEAIVNQLTEPLRIHWEEEMRQAEERAETKIAKLETQLGRVSKDLVETQPKTRMGSPTEEGYAR
jgi:phage terminase large subunit GpA-like protein